jgi:hypothetical protein
MSGILLDVLKVGIENNSRHLNTFGPGLLNHIFVFLHHFRVSNLPRVTHCLGEIEGPYDYGIDTLYFNDLIEVGNSIHALHKQPHHYVFI